MATKKNSNTLAIKIPSAMKATEDVLTAIATLPENVQVNLYKAMQPLAPAKRGMKLAPDTRTQFPFINLRQKSTENAPDSTKIGEYFDDAMTSLGKDVVGYVLLFKEERILFSGAGLACRSPDRRHSIRGIYCDDCPEKPAFRRDASGQTFKEGDCDNCISLIILASDFSGLYRYMVKGKAGQPVQKMLRKYLMITEEIYSQAYRFYSEKREAGSNTYQAHLVEPAQQGDEVGVPTNDELSVIEFLFDKVQDWSDQDDTEAKKLTEQSSGAGPGGGAGDGPQRGSYGPGGNPVDVEPTTTLVGEEGKTEPSLADTPEDHSGSL